MSIQIFEANTNQQRSCIVSKLAKRHPTAWWMDTNQECFLGGQLFGDEGEPFGKGAVMVVGNVVTPTLKFKQPITGFNQITGESVKVKAASASKILAIHALTMLANSAKGDRQAAAIDAIDRLKCDLVVKDNNAYRKLVD